LQILQQCYSTIYNLCIHYITSESLAPYNETESGNDAVLSKQ